MKAPKVLAFVMAGGEGSRLRPFTETLPKPALPFAGGPRIIDFVLSNLYNSSIRAVYVLVQYRPQCLLDHVAEYWACTGDDPDEFVTPVLPQAEPFAGTAHAVYRSLHLVEKHKPDVVAVFAADHVYRMDVRQMVRFHVERDAGASVAAVPVPVEQASAFGIICADHEQRIRAFQEKPREPTPMPGNPRLTYASMGNYLFDPGVLMQVLGEAAERGEHDFGQHVLPRIIHAHRVYAYDLGHNLVPGTRPYEERAYWRDVGNIESYVAAHRDVLGATPRFQLNNREWPIFFGNGGPGAAPRRSAHTRNSILGPGSVADRASVRNSVLQREVHLEPGARIENCILMDGVTVQRGARLRRVVVGGGNTIAAGVCIGYDPCADRERYVVTPSGTVLVPPCTLRGARLAAADAAGLHAGA